MVNKKGGATFAYFSVTATSNGATATTVTAKTSDVGSFTMTTPTANLYLGVTALEMSKEASSDASKDYYAITTNANSGEGVIVSNNQATENYVSVSKVTLSGGDKGTKYHCTAKYTISVSGLETPAKSQVVVGDGKLLLKTETTPSSDGTVTATIGDEKDAELSVISTDHELNSLLSANKDFWIMFDFTKGDSDDTADLKATFKITNDTEREQNYLAGKTINITLTPANDADGKLICSIVEGE